MGVTYFPDGIDAGSSAGVAATLSIGGTAVTANNVVNALAYQSSGKEVSAGTVVVPSGGSGTSFVPSGISSILFVLASPYSSVETVAGFAGVAASHAGGTVTLIGVSGAGTASTANGTATYLVIGS